MEDIKRDQNGNIYTGMPIGNEHHWNYTNCEWHEQKTTPNKWNIRMTSIKRKQVPTTFMGNIEPGTQYHWYIIAKQVVKKVDENTYETDLQGTKYKIGHKRPYWKKFSYEYEDQTKQGRSETQLKIQALNEQLKELSQSNTTL